MTDVEEDDVKFEHNNNNNNKMLFESRSFNLFHWYNYNNKASFKGRGKGERLEATSAAE